MADSFVKPLGPLDITSANVYSTWKDWRAHFTVFNIGSGLASKSEKQQVNAMVCMMGSGAVKLFNTFTYPEGKSKDKLQDVIDKFDNHFKARSSKSSLRQMFKERRQTPSESLLDFVQDVQQLALTAGYKLDEDSEVSLASLSNPSSLTLVTILP